MVVEAIYKLKCAYFALKNTGKILQTQGISNLSMATLKTCSNVEKD